MKNLPTTIILSFFIVSMMSCSNNDPNKAADGLDVIERNPDLLIFYNDFFQP